MGSPASWSRSRTLQTSAVLRADCREVVLSYLLARWCLIWICFNFTGQPRTVQEYVRVGVQGPTYLGFRPADGLSVEFERWATKCRIASAERSLTSCPPPWRSVRDLSHKGPPP